MPGVNSNSISLRRRTANTHNSNAAASTSTTTAASQSATAPTANAAMYTAVTQATEKFEDQKEALETLLASTSAFVTASKNVATTLKNQREKYEKILAEVQLRGEEDKLRYKQEQESYRLVCDGIIKRLQKRIDNIDGIYREFIAQQERRDKVGYTVGLTTTALLFAVGGQFTNSYSDMLPFAGNYLPWGIALGRTVPFCAKPQEHSTKSIKATLASIPSPGVSKVTVNFPASALPVSSGNNQIDLKSRDEQRIVSPTTAASQKANDLLSPSKASAIENHATENHPHSPEDIKKVAESGTSSSSGSNHASKQSTSENTNTPPHTALSLSSAASASSAQLGSTGRGVSSATAAYRQRLQIRSATEESQSQLDSIYKQANELIHDTSSMEEEVRLNERALNKHIQETEARIKKEKAADDAVFKSYKESADKTIADLKEKLKKAKKDLTSYIETQEQKDKVGLGVGISSSTAVFITGMLFAKYSSDLGLTTANIASISGVSNFTLAGGTVAGRLAHDPISRCCKAVTSCCHKEATESEITQLSTGSSEPNSREATITKGPTLPNSSPSLSAVKSPVRALAYLNLKTEASAASEHRIDIQPVSNNNNPPNIAVASVTPIVSSETSPALTSTQAAAVVFSACASNLGSSSIKPLTPRTLPTYSSNNRPGSQGSQTRPISAATAAKAATPSQKLNTSGNNSAITITRNRTIASPNN